MPLTQMLDKSDEENLYCSCCGSFIFQDEEGSYHHIDDNIDTQFCTFTIHQYPITKLKSK